MAATIVQLCLRFQSRFVEEGATFAPHRRDGLGEPEGSCAKRSLARRKPEVGGLLLRARVAYMGVSLGFMQCGYCDLCGVSISVLDMARLVYDSRDDSVPAGGVS